MSLKLQQGLFKLDLVDRHAILGMPLDADTKEVRQRYLKIAYRLHPDTCKAKSDAEKKKASQILSKLVNPSYEQLSKDSSRAEYLLILSGTSKTLVLDNVKTMLTSEPAKQLIQAVAHTDQLYKKLLQALATEQYNSLDRILDITSQLSELNLAYLAIAPGQFDRSAKTTALPAVKIAQTAIAVQKTEPEMPVSAVANYIRRAQDFLERNNPAQAITEMRDALKIEPNNSTCHGLMGLAYLKQNQTSMAKVHINKAWQANSKDPIVVKAKQELDKSMPAESKAQTSAGQSGSSGFLGGLFGGKKK
jgi:curved DNA-binding protein CbpA